jgi:hypothetical protein
MSAPYTHTLTLPYNGQAFLAIAEFVDERFALIFEDAQYRDVAQAAWKATARTSRHYRVAVHDEETNTIIVSQIQ